MAALGTKQKGECYCSSRKILNCPLNFCGSNQGWTGLFGCADLLMRHGGKMVSIFPFFLAILANFVMQPQWQMRERGGGENKLKESENMFFNLSLKLISGSKYPPPTIYKIGAGIQRHREECRLDKMNLFNDIAFLSFRETFDAVMKKRVLEGMFVIKHTENLTNKDENELWEKMLSIRQL